MFAAAVAMLLVLPGSIFCVQLDAYKTRIDATLGRANDLEDAFRDDDFDDLQKRALIEATRRDFPASERIEWEGGSVEASHDWILAKMKELEEARDLKTSLPIVVAVREHLSALAFKIEEMKSGVESTRTKDEDKQKLAEILRREEYQKPQEAKESAFQRVLREFAEWLMDLWPKPASSSPQNVSGFGAVGYILQVLLIVILAALVLFLLFKLLPLLVPKLQRTKGPKPKKRVILGEEIGEHEVASDLFGEAERLAQAGDIRGAIRKGYIALLCDLSDRRIIGLAGHKTNRDYVRDVRSRRDLHPRMKSVTDTFERHWYGSWKSENEDWTRFSEGCKEAIRSA
jgi:hypothetical protein